jgi:thiol-disulfide isomerase/thioredoxin
MLLQDAVLSTLRRCMKLANQRLALLVSCLLLTCNYRAFAEEIKFFDGGIDYWAAPAAKVVDQPMPKVEQKKPSESSSFDWQRVMDPKNDDFFREGDYVPPAAFMEVARDPSDQNIRMWNAYIEKKNTLAARLQQRLQEYAASNTLMAPPGMVQEQMPKQRPTSTSDADIKRYQFRMYFDSQCPHCKRMMQTLAELSEKGFFVEAKQIDKLPFDPRGLPFAISVASPDEVKRHAIASVPFLLVGDLKDKLVYKMAGYKSVSDIFVEIENGVKR